MNKTNRTRKRQTIFFKRWTRTHFGVFRSLNKQVAISTMVLATSIVFAHSELHAQVIKFDSDSIQELEEVVVSGEQEPVAFSKIARIVTIISQKEIEAAPVSNISELLEFALGLEIRQRGAKGVQGDISLRGGTFDQTPILLNGINISDPQTGHHNLNLPLDINSIERIEIISGPAALLFGVNAFSGAINIITNHESKEQIKLLVQAGQFGTLQEDAAITVAHKQVTHLLSTGHKQSSGYLQTDSINNTDYHSANIFYHGKWQSNNQQVDLQAGFATKSFGANSFYTPAFPEQFEATRTQLISLKYTLLQDCFNIKPSTYYRRHHDRFELFRNAAPDWYTMHNYHLTDVAGYHLPLLIKIPYGNILLSLNSRYEHIYSNKLGRDMARTKQVPGENALFDKQAERFHNGAQLAYTLDLNKLYITSGLFFSYYSTYKNRLGIYPAIEASYAIANNIRLIGSYNEAMRLPTFTDLYYSGPTNMGNPHLTPEKSKTIEWGAKYTTATMQLQGSAFLRKGNDIIEWVRTASDDETSIWQTQNLTHVMVKGLNLSVNILPALNYKSNIIKQLSVNYTWLDLNVDARNAETKYINDNLKHNLSFKLSHTIYKKLYADWGVHFQDRAGYYTIYENKVWGKEKAYKPYWIVNLKTGWKNNQWNIYTEIFNALNQEHFDISNVPQPGIWVQCGATFKLEL